MLVIKAVHIFETIRKYMQIVRLNHWRIQMNVHIFEFFSKSMHTRVHIFKNFLEYMHRREAAENYRGEPAVS